MQSETPFQAVLHETPRLDGPTRLRSLLGATTVALTLVIAILVAWTWWVGVIRDREVIPPIEVIIDPHAE